MDYIVYNMNPIITANIPTTIIKVSLNMFFDSLVWTVSCSFDLWSLWFTGDSSSECGLSKNKEYHYKHK